MKEKMNISPYRGCKNDTDRIVLSIHLDKRVDFAYTKNSISVLFVEMNSSYYHYRVTRLIFACFGCFATLGTLCLCGELCLYVNPKG